MTVITVAALWSGSVGCTKTSKRYCEMHPDDREWCAETIDAPSPCTSSAQCEAPTSVCDVTGSMTCVECTPDEDASCTGATPACVNNGCEACTSHSQCDSDVCLPEGSCADDATVAYVQANGTGSACTQMMPCGTLAVALATDRSVVKMSGLVKDNQTTTINAETLTILAEPGAILDRDGDGVVLEVRNTGADVAIFDLQISGASGGPGDVGVSMPSGGTPRLSLTRVTVTGNVGGGILAASGTLTATRSTISANAGGGISISGAQFDITNSFITGNGGGSSIFGGVRIDSINGTGTYRLAFNTVTANFGPASAITGVACGTVLTPLVFSNNIVFDNQIGVGRMQVGGNNCSWTYSDIGPDTVGGIGNINEDPLFVNAGQNNFHIMPDSPAKDAADPAATLSIDFDGDDRPQGAARDIGADEIDP